MVSIRYSLLFLVWIILPSTTLCGGHGARPTDGHMASLLRRVAALEDRDTRQQDINAKLQTDLDLEKKTSAEQRTELDLERKTSSELRNELLQLKRDNADMYSALDMQGKLIAELKESLTKRDAMHAEMVDNLKNELLGQTKQNLKNEGLAHQKYSQKVDSQTGGNETLPIKQDIRKVAVRNHIRQVGTEVTVAFSAGLSHILSTIGVDQNIVFDHVEINTGNGYNPHHGLFIAPVSGTYVLHTTIYAGHEYGRVQLYCHFVVNGNRKSGLYVESISTASDTGSQMLITRLNKGDDVSVQIGRAVANLHGSGNLYSTFSGFLLAQDYSGSSVVG